MLPGLSLRRVSVGLAALAFTASPVAARAQQATQRPMTWLDVQDMRQVGAPAYSTDGRWALYTLSTPDWASARRQNDIYLASTTAGSGGARRLTFTADKNEVSPAWSRDGAFFAFLSDRDAPAPAANRPPTLPTSGPGAPYFPPAVGGGVGGTGYQLYVMRPDGGEARRITNARDGVSTFAFSKDGQWLVYRSGSPGTEQLYALRVAAVANGDSSHATQLSHHASGVGLWRWTPDSRHIYFATADTVDPDEQARLAGHFDVRVRNAEVPVSSLWSLDVGTRQETRLTRDTSYSVGDFTISPDGRYVGFHGLSSNRFARNILEQNDNADLYLLDVGAGAVERLTRNTDIAESPVSFSPDSRRLAFSAPDEFQFMHNQRVWLRDVGARGTPARKLGGSYDGDVTVGFWSKDGHTIFFNEGVRATEQLLALDVDADAVRPVIHEQAAVRVTQDEETGRITINYSDPRTPPTLYTVSSPAQLESRAAWVQLSDANPQVRNFALGAESEIMWTSADGRSVGGILVRPVGFQRGHRYPLIVSIHGGPAAADVLGFNGGYGAQVYAGAGYMVLMPNYRNSTNYGQQFKIESQGDYFTKGYQDIMAGVDHLIAEGLVDSTEMGVLGWSAGGHWSNWILTHTDRFKAISTGAGVFNWISMYGESDTQRIRQWYLGDKLYFDDMEHWWKQSPAAYIRNAKTPTMIHVVDNDPRVPRPQSEELHMALVRLGVPTEMYVYPGNTHGIPDPRNQLFKSTVEMEWMDYWVRHTGHRFAWRDVLRTLPDSAKPVVTPSNAP